MRLSLKILLSSLFFAAAAAQAAKNPLAELFRGNDPARQAEQRKTLEALVAAKPQDAEAWLKLAEFSFEVDEPEQTLELIGKGVASVGMPERLWRLAVEVYLADAGSGIEMVQRPGVFRHRKNKPQLDEAAFRKQSLESALGALDKVMACRGALLIDSTRLRVQVLSELQRWSEAEAQAKVLLAGRWTPEDAASEVFCLLSQKRLDEASSRVAAYLEKAPRSPDLHAVAALLWKERGEPEKEALERRKSSFYRRLMPDSELVYSDETSASMENLFAQTDGSSGMFDADRRKDVIKAEIERLAVQGTESSSELLATLAYSHYAHGELENRAFEILGQRKDAVRIRRILAHARSTCTISGCLNQMIVLRLEDTYDVLSTMLERDGGMYPMFIVDKMVTLGDPRSGAALREYSRKKEAAFFEEALIALGHFDSPETRAHLEHWLKDDEAASFAAVGLYLLTHDAKYLKIVRRAQRKLSSWSFRPIAGYLETVPQDKACAEILKAHRERVEKERRERERKA